MARWARGAEHIEAMIDSGELQKVSGGDGAARARKAATSLLAHQGLRPTTKGGHIAVVDAVRSQFPGVPGIKSLDRLRRRRNEAEYPDPGQYGPISDEEARESIVVAKAALDAADRFIDRPEIGLFR